MAKVTHLPAPPKPPLSDQAHLAQLLNAATSKVKPKPNQKSAQHNQRHAIADVLQGVANLLRD